MTAQLPDWPEHVRRSEPVHKRRRERLSLTQSAEERQNDLLRLRLKSVIRDLILVYQGMRSYEYEENLEAIEEVLQTLYQND
ncbi:MAG: hypothetical protein H0Z34_03560 [Brevibacillus sp.]|nr:hypothetical protein [Brevibacillus sp.]